MACKLQNTKPKATSMSSSGDWSHGRAPLLSPPEPAHLPTPIHDMKEADEASCNVSEGVSFNDCMHTTPYNDKGLRILSHNSDRLETCYEVDIAGSMFWAAEQRLEASFVGRLLLAEYEPSGLTYLFMSRNSEIPKRVGLHLVDNGPEKFSICGSECLHGNLVSKADLEATWRGRMFLIEKRSFVLSFMYYVWLESKLSVSSLLRDIKEHI